MKKLFPGILALLMCFGSLAACGDKDKDKSSSDASSSESSSSSSSTVTDPHEADLQDAKEYVQGLLSGKTFETRKSFTLINSFSFYGATEKYDISWSVDVTSGVTIEEGETEDTVVIAELDADLPFVLTGTITDPEGCHSTTFTIDGVALKALNAVPQAITAKPVENTAYKLYVYQTSKESDCYFNGEMSGFYFATVDSYADAVDLYVEYKANSEEFNVYFTKDGTKTYIGVEEGWNSKNNYWTFNVKMGETAPSSFVWSDDLKTIITTVPCRSKDDNKNQEAAQTTTSTLYLGNYSTFMTFSASTIDKAATSNVGGLVIMADKANVTADQKVAAEKEILTVVSEVVGSQTIELPATGSRYNDVTIAWSVSGDNATLDGNALKITAPTADTTITLTATITCGEASATKEFTVKLNSYALPAADSVISIEKAIEIGETVKGDTANKYYISGKITSIASTTYGNFTIEDENGKSIYVYGTYDATGANRYDAMENAPQVGDTVKLYSIVSYYNNAQLKNAWIVEVTAAEKPKPGDSSSVDTPDSSESSSIDTPDSSDSSSVDTPEYTVVTIPEANAAADGTKIEVSGTVSQINTVWSEQYSNISVTIIDKEGNTLYLFRLATNVALGDIITVKGTIGSYNDNKQMTAGATATITGHDSYYDYVEKTIDEIASLPAGTNVIVTGTVVEIAEEYNSSYKNMSVYIADDATYLTTNTKVYLYRLNGQVTLGQTIVVKGVTAVYNEQVQITGATFTLAETQHSHDYSDATCKKLATCKICGATTGELAEHSYVDGKCSECKAPENGSAQATKLAATFTFGTDDSSKTDENTNQDGNENTAYTETAGDYTLTLNSSSKVYDGSYDAKGNACLKLGTSKAAGSFSFTVADDVTKVVIYVAGYKKNAGKVQINGGDVQTISTTSANGEYTAIEIDTTTNKTVTFTTASGGYRVKINTIEWYVADSNSTEAE